MVHIFWISVFMIFYAYFGYPICLLLLTTIKRQKKVTDFQKSSNDFSPRVSFIVTVYNEEERVGAKIENSIAQDYPRERFEIIVASDCSDDRTDEIVKSFEEHGVKFVRATERRGKESAQKLAVDSSMGDILVFSDVATILETDGVSNLVKNFADTSIGCVSSEDRIIETDGTGGGEGAYVKYEIFLRKLESKVNTLVGLSGSLFAARRSVCEDWAIDLPSDFNTLLNSIRQGMRGITDPNSIGYYKNIVDEEKEFSRKMRTVLRGISVLMQNLLLLNPLKYGLFSWQLASHKLCRWLVPLFLILAFISNLAVVLFSGNMVVFLILQIAVYLAALLYYLRNKRYGRVDWDTSNGREGKAHNQGSHLVYIFRIPYYFLIANFAILISWIKYFKGDRAIFWEPSRR